MKAGLFAIWEVLHNNIRWMTWNLFLAFVPLVLSVWLFRMQKYRSWLWWVGFLVFVAFLPNAPYVLTDIIHLYDDIRTINSAWLITFLALPMYLLFILAGFGAYILSLINLCYYLHRIGRKKWTLNAELIFHALCAVGVYLGRFQRFNSWDFITQPNALATSLVENLLARRSWIIIAITFMIIASLYWIVKQAIIRIFLHKAPELVSE